MNENNTGEKKGWEPCPYLKLSSKLIGPASHTNPRTILTVLINL